MAKEMLINVSEGEECRIALVEDGRLEELYIERTSSTSHVGNIYKGKVTNVEASIQAAFIDFGLGRNGFLHVSDLLPDYFGKKGEDVEEYVGKKMARRDRPPIQRCLRRGDEIIVQVIKEGIGTKGPTLSSYLSVSGKMLVMMPGVSGRGVSRKIEDEQERRRLKQILTSLEPPEDCGFIIRTEAVGKSKADIERDLKYLSRLWEQMKKKRDASRGPTELYTEGDLVTRTIRDVFNTDVDRVVIDNADVAERVRDVVRLTSPKGKDKVEVHDSPIPLFHKYGIERDIELMYSRHVPLPSGGSLVIDSTEAIVAIDVNSGKFRDHSDAETTAFRTDMEAADEICRQLKLRDLGGVIICDFIDLRYERHRRELEQRIVDNFKNDKAKTKVLRMSQFGIIEITRQRMRPSLKRSVYFDCPHCKGAGLVKTPESMSLDVMRRLAIAMNDLKVFRAELAVCADVAIYLNNKKRRALADLEDRTKKRVVVKTDPSLGLDEMRLDLYDNRDGLVLLPELSDVLTSHPHTSQLHTRQPGRHGPPGQNGGGRGDNRRGNGGRSQEQRRQERERELADDRMEFDDEEREQRGEPRRDDRVDEPRRDDARRDEPRRDGRGRDDGRRDERGRGDRSREDRGADGRRREEPREAPRDESGRGGRDGARRDGGRDRRDGPRAPQAAAPVDHDDREPVGHEQPQDGHDERGHDDRGDGPNEGEGGGRRRRRRRRRGRGRGGQGQQPQEPLTAFGDYPEDQAEDRDDDQPAAASDRPRDDRGDGGRRDGRRDQREDFRDRRGDRRGEFPKPPAAGGEAAPTAEPSEDDLGPAPEPVESGYEEELDYRDEEPGDASPIDESPAEVPSGSASTSDVQPQGASEPQAGDAVESQDADEPAEAVADESEPATGKSKKGARGKAAAKKPAKAAKAPAKPAAKPAAKGKAKAAPVAKKRSGRKSDDTPADAPRARIADEAPPVKRRSGDKHLVAEPDADVETPPEVEPEPVAETPRPAARRSSSRTTFRDLDAIPDDYD